MNPWYVLKTEAVCVGNKANDRLLFVVWEKNRIRYIDLSLLNILEFHETQSSEKIESKLKTRNTLHLTATVSTPN